jgi:hypothetical protein
MWGCRCRTEIVTFTHILKFLKPLYGTSCFEKNKNLVFNLKFCQNKNLIWICLQRCRIYPCVRSVGRGKFLKNVSEVQNLPTWAIDRCGKIFIFTADSTPLLVCTKELRSFRQSFVKIERFHYIDSFPHSIHLFTKYYIPTKLCLKLLSVFLQTSLVEIFILTKLQIENQTFVFFEAWGPLQGFLK